MKEYDLLANRLLFILTKLNNGEKLTIEQLVKEFNVSKRTIQRDLHERLRDKAHIPIKKENGIYSLEQCYLGKVNFDDIRHLSRFSNLDKMFPSFSKDFSQRLLDKNITKAYLIKTYNFEEIKEFLKEFQEIEKAIINKHFLKLVYAKKERRVQPYKLANVKGIWYLVALQDSIIKTFTFRKITQLQVLNEDFTIDSKILRTIEDNETIWFSNTKVEVILKIDTYASQFFKRRKIMAYQKILEEYDDNSLLVSAQMTFENEILELVRSMIPHITIVSPLTLQKKLEESLHEYISRKI
jgi:predicted DNA-binding transcriptional regulator YafY